MKVETKKRLLGGYFNNSAYHEYYKEMYGDEHQEGGGIFSDEPKKPEENELQDLQEERTKQLAQDQAAAEQAFDILQKQDDAQDPDAVDPAEAAQDQEEQELDKLINEILKLNKHKYDENFDFENFEEKYKKLRDLMDKQKSYEIPKEITDIGKSIKQIKSVE